MAWFERGSDPRDRVEGVSHPRIFEVFSELIALGVDIGRDMMGRLPGLVTQSDAAVEGRRPSQTARPVSPG